MLTIGQLAGSAGVTVAAVRHYHRIGLLAEPARDSSGYRSYDAGAVVRLIRIHVLARAGVPLARVEHLLDADPAAFAEEVRGIDRRLCDEIQQLEDTRVRLARLAAGEQLALPAGVVGYLDRLRGLGVEERYIELECDAWLMVAAQVPDRIDGIIAGQHRDLDDPDVLRRSALLGTATGWGEDDPRLVEVADLLDRIATRALDAGAVDDGFDDRFVDLLDATMADSGPAPRRLLALTRQRGWTGWTRLQRVEADPPSS